MGLNSSRVNPAIVSREEQQAFIPIYTRMVVRIDEKSAGDFLTRRAMS